MCELKIVFKMDFFALSYSFGIFILFDFKNYSHLN